MRKVYSDTDIRSMVADWSEEIEREFLREPVFYKLLEGTQSQTERRELIEDYVYAKIFIRANTLIEEGRGKVEVDALDGRHEFNSAEEFTDWILRRKEHYGSGDVERGYMSAFVSDLEDLLKSVKSRIDEKVRNLLSDIFHDSLVLSHTSDIYPGLKGSYKVFAEETELGHSLFKILIREGSTDEGSVCSEISLEMDSHVPAKAFNELPNSHKAYVGYLIARVFEEYREVYPLDRGVSIKDKELEAIAYEEGVKGVLRELEDRKLSLSQSMGMGM